VTFGRLLSQDGGATAIEYGLIVACVTLAILGGMTLFAGNENVMYTKISTAVSGATY
jgi:pilus assembly protein Flp/PilA